MPNNGELTIIGGGLAGAEAAWQAAQRGIEVCLYEMRPKKQTPAHKTGLLAELVCSNSLKSNLLTTASGLLKEEMRILNSVVIACADDNRVPAGEALAVDRDKFAECVTERVSSLSNVTLIRKEITKIPKEGTTIIASGPLTSDALAREISKLTGREHLYFYDAVAPTVTADSINYDKAFRASRYGKGEAAYLNCPMIEEEYNAFWEALISAERVPLAEFEPLKLFEGCMPIEELASRGKQTLLFGPLKPVGLIDPRTGKRPFAVVQLRQENIEGTLYGLVGFQTRLKWGEQERVFRMIPCLEHAEFVRFGVMHRNTYIDSPRLLQPTMKFDPQKTTRQPQTKNTHSASNLFFAGQITGVEGYVESAAMGLVAGINASRLLKGEELLTFPRESMIGSLANYISSPTITNFQPMNANFGILPKPEPPIRNKQERQRRQVEIAIGSIRKMALVLQQHVC
ncbi:MAG: FADH(2)-oxidizing methylenetetrahydrofolate--tRNA-(uracil(54)-C(5))-methyltransferase TrmFO [Armatimonadetes bacterium]|nr:FADH(2)-oxidizing methylenetetrahydrofolate--tRNA-(uracil(54)-C(5))-methyltransferase TrmFO [Armatimonadota bacterium]